MRIIIFLLTIIPSVIFSYQFYYNHPSNTTYRVFSASVQNLQQEGRSTKIIEQAYEAMLRAGELSKDKEVLFNGEYRTSSRIFGLGGAYESGDSKVYKSLFRRTILGKITSLSDKDYYPVVRSVPQFSTKDTNIGDTWSNRGIEVQDFGLLGYKDPFIVPFRSEYVYAGDLNLKQEELDKLIARYKKYKFEISKETEDLINNKGQSNNETVEYAIIGLIYRVSYDKNDYPEQTQSIRKARSVPVERVNGHYKGLVFWNKKTREEVFSLGEYDFTYYWENGEKRHWTGKEYGYVDIFKQDSKLVDNLEKDAKASLDKSIKITKEKQGIKLTFGDLLFNFNKINLRKNVIKVLNQVSKMLQKYPKAVLRISGHSDNIGSKKAKMEISQGRAKAVTDFLMENGIDPERVVFSGKGDSEPLLPNTSSSNRKKNRRVELDIITQ